MRVTTEPAGAAHRRPALPATPCPPAPFPRPAARRRAVLLVCAYRDAEMPAPACARWSKILRVRPASVRALGGSINGDRCVRRDSNGSRARPKLIEHLTEQTAGNPFLPVSARAAPPGHAICGGADGSYVRNAPHERSRRPSRAIWPPCHRRLGVRSKPRPSLDETLA